MKIDPTASWGYPVLRSNIDDYVQCEFQSSIDLELGEDMNSIYLNFQISLSVPELKDLIDTRQANIFIYVHCRDTWFGQLIDVSAWNGQVTLDKKMIEGETEFLTLVIATKSIKNFKSAKFHPEYDQSTFDIEQYQILAISDPESQYISRDILKNVSSLFDYAVNYNLSEGEWRVKLTENRLVIEANETQVGCLRKGENTPQGKAVLLNGIFLPAVAQAVASLTDDPGQYEDLNWARVVGAKLNRISRQGLDSLGKAQELLRMPTTWLNKNMKWMDYES
jgi:hypothetical protein